MNVLSLTHPCSNSSGGEDVSYARTCYTIWPRTMSTILPAAQFYVICSRAACKVALDFCNDNNDRHYVSLLRPSRKKKEEAMINIWNKHSVNDRKKNLGQI